MSVPLPVGGHRNTTIVASKWGCSSDLWYLVDRNPRAKFPDLIWVGSSRRLFLGHALLRTPHLTVVECAACPYRQRLVVTALFPFADTISRPSAVRERTSPLFRGFIFLLVW